MATRDEVLEWLKEIGAELQDDTSPDERLEWSVVFNYPPTSAAHTILVGKPKDKAFLVVQSGIAPSEEHEKAIAGLGDPGAREFRFGLMRDLLLSPGGQYSIKFDDKKLVGVTGSRRIWLSHVSVVSLEAALDDVLRIVQLAKIHIRLAGGELSV